MCLSQYFRLRPIEETVRAASELVILAGCGRG